METIEVPEYTRRYMPVKDYAAKMKITTQAVYKAIKEGRLQFKKIGTYTLVLSEQC